MLFLHINPYLCVPICMLVFSFLELVKIRGIPFPFCQFATVLLMSSIQKIPALFYFASHGKSFQETNLPRLLASPVLQSSVQYYLSPDSKTFEVMIIFHPSYCLVAAFSQSMPARWEGVQGSWWHGSAPPPCEINVFLDTLAEWGEQPLTGSFAFPEASWLIFHELWATPVIAVWKFLTTLDAFSYLWHNIT